MSYHAHVYERIGLTSAEKWETGACRGDGSLSLRLLPVQRSLCGRDIFHATLLQTVQDVGVAELQRRLRELGQ